MRRNMAGGGPNQRPDCALRQPQRQDGEQSVDARLRQTQRREPSRGGGSVLARGLMGWARRTCAKSGGSRIAQPQRLAYARFRDGRDRGQPMGETYANKGQPGAGSGCSETISRASALPPLRAQRMALPHGRTDRSRCCCGSLNLRVDGGKRVGGGWNTETPSAHLQTQTRRLLRAVETIAWKGAVAVHQG